MDSRALTKHAGRFFSGTLFSRISGMVREVVMAAAFGDHPAVGGFFVAFRVSNLLRRLLGEGPLQSAFIPHFEELRVKDEARANLFFRQLLFIVASFLIAVIFLGEGGLLVFGHQWSISKLVAWMLPGLLFMSLYGLNISYLYCAGIFFFSSFAPVICNLIWVGGALLFAPMGAENAVEYVSIAVLVGMGLQWLFTFIPTIHLLRKSPKEKIQFSHEVKQLGKYLGYGTIGAGAVQLSAFFDTIFARLADVRGPVYLWYSLRLEQLVLALFGIALINTLTPALSRAYKKGEREEADALFALGFQRVFLVLLPLTVALIVLGPASVNLLFGREAFSHEGIATTSLSLWAYGLSLMPVTLVLLFSSVFYAHKDFKTPMIFALFAVFLNLVGNALFVFYFGLGAVSIAISTTLSALFNCLFLYRELKRLDFFPKIQLKEVFRVAAASLCTLGTAVVLEIFFFQGSLSSVIWGGHFVRGFARQGQELILLSTMLLLVFILFATLFKCKALYRILREMVGREKSTTSLET